MQRAMAADAEDHVIYLYGWSPREPTGSWTDGPLAALAIQRAPGRRGAFVRLAGHMIEARADEPQVVDIWSGWRRLGRLSWQAWVRGAGLIRLPSALHRREVITLQFRIRTPIAPADIGLSEDNRLLGLFLEDVRSSPCVRDAAAAPMHFHQGSGDLNVLWSGWSFPEAAGCWTDGPDAVLRWTATRELPRGAQIVIQASGFVLHGEGPRGFVSVNGRRAGDLDGLDWKSGSVSLWIPISASLRGREITVHVHIDNPRSPREFGLSSDERKLGVFAQSVRVEISQCVDPT
jgi:hypothetical protein